MTSESLQDLYKTSEETVRASFGGDALSALPHYASLVEFVSTLCPPTANLSLLDIGCGTGWSTFSFALTGYESTGIDLNPAVFEPPPLDGCILREGSATDIPFSPESFDVVICNQCLEHVPQPRTALEEMIRVCRPGGVIVIVGPNLVSPIAGIAHILRPSSWKEIRFRRQTDMPIHPYGNTLLEIFIVAIIRMAQLIAKLTLSSPHFTMREADPNPPFHADNDACYLCNPTDLICYFKEQGFQIKRCGKLGRLPLTYLFAGGTWVVVRKPEPTEA